MATEISNGCPYKGLQPYTENDRDYFFGRESDRETIASNLFAAPLTILYGSSGVGKSSVLQAGAIPQLRLNRRVVVALFGRWQGDNFDHALKTEMLNAVCESTGKSAAEVLQEVSRVLDKEMASIDELSLDGLLTACAAAFGRRILVIFDQFEEYFLYHSATAGPEGFDAEFARAANQHDSGVHFMLAMREEELSKLDRFRPRIPNLLSNLLRLDHLDSKAATNAIREPLRVYNEKHPQKKIGIEDALVEEIITQVKPQRFTEQDGGQLQSSPPEHAVQSDSKIETPFLQMVLVRLWNEEQSQGSASLRLETFQKLGGAKQIARAHLDMVMEQLSDSEREVAAAVLRFLVTPKGSKIALDPQTLAGFANQEEEAVRSVLTLLSSGKEMRILRKVTVPGQAGRYELFHDVLGPAILEWRARYVQALQLVQERAQVAQAFSLERQRRMRQALGVLIVLLLAMGGMTVYAFQQSAKARRQEEIARKALGDVQRAREELELEKKKVEKERDRANVEATNAGENAKLAKRNEEEAVAATAAALAAKQTAESERSRANRQEKLARDAAEIRAFGLKGFDATRAGDMDEAIKQFSQARVLYQRAGDHSGEAYALVNIGESYAEKVGGLSSNTLRIYDAMGVGDESQLSEQDTMRLYYLLLSRAGGSEDPEQSQRNQNEAIEFLKKAVAVINQAQHPDIKSRASIYRRMGDIYFLAELQESMRDRANPKAEDFEKLPEFYNQAVKDYTLIGLHNDAALLLTRMGFLAEAAAENKTVAGAKNKNDDDSLRSIKFYEDAQAAFHRAGNKLNEALLLDKLGKYYADKENIQKAIDNYSQAIPIYQDLKNVMKEGESYSSIAKLYSKWPNKSHTKEALVNYELARSVFQRERNRIANQPAADLDDNEERRDDLLAKEHVVLGAVVDLYKDDVNRDEILEKYFASVIESYPADSPTNGTTRAETLERIGFLFENSLKDTRQAVKYYALAAPVWNKASERAKEAKTLVRIGELYEKLQDKQNAIASFDRAREIYQNQAKDPALRTEVIESLLRIAKAYTGLGQRRSAFELYGQVFQLYGEGATPITDDRVTQLMRLANQVLLEEEAAKWFQSVADYQRNAKNLPGEAEVLTVAGNYYEALGNTQKALDYYKRSFSANRSTRFPQQLTLLKTIGRLYFDQGDEKGAAQYFKEVLDAYRKENSSMEEADALFAIASAYRESGKKHEAIDYFTQALQAQCKLKIGFQMTSTLGVLIGLFRESGETQEANRLSQLAKDNATVNDCDYKVKKLPLARTLAPAPAK